MEVNTINRKVGYEFLHYLAWISNKDYFIYIIISDLNPVFKS